jgi:tetratricopeptide (TPR) repeat protein
MKSAILAIVSVVLAAPAWADRRVDDAVAKAEEQIRKQRPEDAVKTMQKAAAQANSVEAYIALARIQRRAGQRDAAAESTRKAIGAVATSPDKAEALATVAGVLLSEGSGKDALGQAQQAVAAQETAVTLAALARAQARVEDIPGALASIDKAMKAGAPTPVVQEAHGEVLLAAGRLKEAEAAYRQAATADARRTTARAGLASALAALGRHAEAVQEARAAVQADASSSEAQIALGSVLLSHDPKLWNDAISAAQEAVSLVPTSVSAHLAVGRIFEAVSNLDQAAAAYKAALAVDPDYVPALVGLVQLLARQGKYDEALAEARKLAAARPNSASAHLLLGTMLARRDQWAEAASSLEKATAGGVDSAEAWAMLGTARYYMRRMPEAAAAYKKVVEREPNNAGYRTTYGIFLGLAGQAEAGILELRKVTSDPSYKDADAWINLGWLYRSAEPKKPAESAAAYQRALQIDPAAAQAVLGLGWAHYYARNYDGAIETFDKLARMDEALAGIAHNGAAWSYVFKKDPARADELRKKAEAAGRVDAKLTSNIERVRRGIAAEERVADKADDAPVRPATPVVTADSLIQTLYGGNPGHKISAASQCRKFGSACLDGLITAVLKDPHQDVRIAAANAIAAMGKAGKKADPHLRHVLESTKCDIPSPDCLQREASMERLQKAVGAALRSVNGL